MLKKGYLIGGVVAISLVLVLALVLSFSFAPVKTLVSEDANVSTVANTSQYWYYEDYEDGIMLVGNSVHWMATMVIPREVDGKKVVAIGASLYTSTINAPVETAIIPNTVRYIEANAFAQYPNVVLFFEGDNTASFDPDWNLTNNPYVTNCEIVKYTYQGDYFWERKTAYYLNSFMDTDIHNAQNDTGVRFKIPVRTGLDKDVFKGFDYDQNATEPAYTRINQLPEATGNRVYAIYYEGEPAPTDYYKCVAEGTLVTLADGTKVAVEELTGEEELLVWDMEKGAYSTSPILFIDHEEAALNEIIELTFSDGTQVKVIDEHGFFNVETQKYVYLREDAYKYIGQTFNKGSENVTLVDVNIYDEYVATYSPVTKNTLCLYVNGMLSMPGATEGFANIFTVENMKIKAPLKDLDVALYGLYTYEEFCSDVVEVPQEAFEAVNGQYLKISMAKGLITKDEIKSLVNRYGVFFAQDEEVVEVSVFDKIINAIKSFFESIVNFFN